MDYVFQVVPASDLYRYHSILGGLESPIDRHQSLRLGACCVLVSSLAQQCLDGIAEEKRQLAVWVRNQRSGVRMMRFKGASKYRGALNADISNASDRARNQLEQLRIFAPEARHQAEKVFLQASQFVSLEEATAYLPAFKDEVRKQQSVKQAKAIALFCLVAGLILLFIHSQTGLILLAIPVGIWLLKRGEWQSLREAEQARSQQIMEIRERRAIEAQFVAELDSSPFLDVDETEELSIAAIAMDLKAKYVLLDVACRDLNSLALSWEELAAEIFRDTNTSSASGLNPERKLPPPPPPPPLPLLTDNQHPSGRPCYVHKSNIDLSVHQMDGGAALSCRMGLDEIRQIMRQLGYKRLPSSLDGISARAQERISRYIASQSGVIHQDYVWTYICGEFKAVPLVTERSAEPDNLQ